MGKWKERLKSIFIEEDPLTSINDSEKDSETDSPNTLQSVEQQPLTLQQILDQFDDSADFVHNAYLGDRMHVMYFSHLVNEDRLERDCLPPLIQSDNPLKHLEAQSMYKPVSAPKQSPKEFYLVWLPLYLITMPSCLMSSIPPPEPLRNRRRKQ